MVAKNKRPKKLKEKRVAARALAEPTTAAEFGSKKATDAAGSSGTQISGGWFREETLPALQGQKAAEEYDKMRRRESQVAMLLSAIKNALLSATWCFDVKDENNQQQKDMKALCEWQFFEALEEGWQQFLEESLTMIDFGHSVFECITASQDVKQLGKLVTYYKKLGFRAQKTIWRWKLEKGTGKIIAIEQQVNASDIAKSSLVDIPGEFLLVFTNKKEGDNYEGISALRPMYGAYLRKDLYLKLVAIGVEKYAMGTPVGTIPTGKGNSEEKERFEEVLEAYVLNESAWITIPEGWKIEIQKGEFDPSKVVELLKYEDEQMVKAVVANFLALGTGGNGGAYSLGSDLSDFFLGGIQAYANIICNAINRKLVPQLIRYNMGDQADLPKLKCSGINDKAGKEIAEIAQILTNSGVVKADMKLEEFMRQLYKWPKADPTTAREKPQPTLPGAGGNSLPGADDADQDEEGDDNGGTPKAKTPPPPSEEDEIEAAERGSRIVLADRYVKDFDKGKDALKAIMPKHLRAMADDLLKKLRKNWEGLSEDNKLNAVKDVAISSALISAYRNEMKEVAAGLANAALAQAKKEVPTAKKVKFGDYDKLNPIVKKAILAQLSLVVDAQAADLSKVVFFQWNSSAASQTSVEAIVNDVESRVQPMLEGSTKAGMSIDAAAGDLTAHVVQNTRNAFFFEPEVLDQIESFTFTNDDPVSEICANLNGQTFLPNDPAAEQFYPPLHHNCKSRLTPNLKGDSGNPKVTGLAVVADSVEERQRIEGLATLHECGGH